MTSFRIRPRFRIEVELTPEELKERFRERIAQPGAPCTAAYFPEHIVLRLPIEEQHLWSPQLELALEEQEGGALIRGLYGPKPQVWTFFAFAYGALGVLGLFIGIIGTSQLGLGLPAHILWVLPLLAGIALFLYILSQTGQKLGAEQTFTLHHFFEETVNKKVGIG